MMSSMTEAELASRHHACSIPLKMPWMSPSYILYQYRLEPLQSYRNSQKIRRFCDGDDSSRSDWNRPGLEYLHNWIRCGCVHFGAGYCIIVRSCLDCCLRRYNCSVATGCRICCRCFYKQRRYRRSHNNLTHACNYKTVRNISSACGVKRRIDRSNRRRGFVQQRRSRNDADPAIDCAFALLRDCCSACDNRT